jgi:transketolase
MKERTESAASLTDAQLATLKDQATEVRRKILRMVTRAKSGHVGGSLSAADLLVCLYGQVMRHDPANPQWPDRDRYVQSKGHCSPVLYAVLAMYGYFPESDLDTFRRPGSHLQGHPCTLKTPGVEASTGTLGLGLSTACGRALAARIRGQSHHTYVLCGDGEQQEGQIWEAAMFASKYRLDHLIAFTDRNRLQTDGDTEQVMPLDPLGDKWTAFGWDVQEIDGHDMRAILRAIETAKERAGRPHMIILNTVKGKGVSFMENEAMWHGTPPTEAQCERAIKELNDGL